ncbi:hypothetical protein, conserved [Trypanosoma brucei gambiense DAL972]|uniref:DUF676 domain-containing protein n=1 Tax=Trypanosoma brucei gambiense (strain MHOM/CI/86/DAL972) TaxID=679716 RepID=C9ZV41_TRYB9|nr:hypothetical protein, conserved [Trypanosoma brucei gambiense DAL972]CBH13279.1 hypothetical protein, conserved [Trypanosoma brucei gambiense DAL972]|eukprot:XP_011775556.1 hypothetical protein, conserved [Trypanosoma brucei gambiense DAL972]
MKTVIRDPCIQNGCRRFVLMQHGLWAGAWDFNAIAAELYCQTGSQDGRSRRGGGGTVNQLGNIMPSDVVRTKSSCGGSLFARGNLTCFSSGANALIGSLRSTSVCAHKLLQEFLPVFTEWLDTVENNSAEKLSFSCVGHSFGGIILREALYLLLVSDDAGEYSEGLFDSVKTVRDRLATAGVVLQHFVTIATPHCGAAECLPTLVYRAAWGIAKLFAPSISEILLNDEEALLSERLLDKGHIEALRMFHKRILFANTQKDVLVGFATSSLMFDGVAEDKVRIIGRPQSDLPCAPEFENDEAAYSRVIHLKRLRVNGDLSDQGADQVGVGSGEEKARSQRHQQTLRSQGTGSSKVHRSPREIAAVLRSELDWDLIALRYNNPLPVAHIACIGWCQQLEPTPELVQRIAAEILNA